VYNIYSKFTRKGHKNKVQLQSHNLPLGPDHAAAA